MTLRLRSDRRLNAARGSRARGPPPPAPPTPEKEQSRPRLKWIRPRRPGRRRLRRTPRLVPVTALCLRGCSAGVNWSRRGVKPRRT
eukprot:scaffold26754_cov51-Isochrysis_galbana.AAC.1